MTELQVFVQAMLPVAGYTGIELIRAGMRTLVKLGADLAAVAERADEGAPFHIVAAYASDGFVEVGLGAAADVVELEARCRMVSGASPDATWQVLPAGADAMLALLVRGEMSEPLRAAFVIFAERSAAELSRMRAEERLRLVSNAAGETVWEWSVGSDRVEWNHDAPMTRDEWLARIHPADRARVEESLRELVAGTRSSWTIEYRLTRPDGTSGSLQERGVVVRAIDGRALRLIGSITDVTQTKAFEQRLVLAERMASMGTLAAGVAHEINNPLAYVKGNIEHVIGELRGVEGLDPDLFAALEEAREGADRVKKIVQDLRLFSRPHDSASVPTDIERIIESALALARNDIRHRARLETSFGHPPPVDVNEARFGQVILNLLVNAIHSLPEGHPETNVIHVETGVDDEGKVFVVVMDTGAGIPREVIGRIFDPFFTTKPVGQGTGLGLSIAHSIVTSLGGQITVDSAPELGSTFRLTLPASKATAVEAQTLWTAPPTRRKRILVVDDDPRVAALVQRTLAREHDVELATGGRAAIEKLTADPSFDVVICDLMMPDVSGADVYEELTRVRPELSRGFVFLTGGAFTSRTQEFLKATSRPVIEKPFGADELRRVVRSVR